MVASIADQLRLAQDQYQAGKLAAAEGIYRQVVGQDAQLVEAWFWLALIADQLGRPADSVDLYQKVLELQPGSAEAYGNLGSVLLKLGRVDAAIAQHRKSLELLPRDAKAHYNLAIALYRNNQTEDAIHYYQQAVMLMPDYVNAHHNLGMALHRQGRTEDAIAHYRQAIVLEPTHASAHNSLGVSLYQQGKLDEAIAHYRQAIALVPSYVSALDNLGIALKQQGKLEEALVQFQQAIALHPSYANAYINLSNTFRELDKFDQAIAHCQEAIRLQPTNADAHNTFGCILVDRAQFEAAIGRFEDAIRHRPDFADAHLNLGIILLQTGEFERGFAEYHWRWKTKQCPDLRYTQALWSGNPIPGKVILLTAEQGFGDTIQFARYAPLVAQRGGIVVIACQKPLMRLLATVPGVDHCVDRDQDNVEIHTHAPLLELPYILGTTVDTIPATVPYLFPPADAQSLPTSPLAPFKIGFVWATNPTNSTAGKRSCPLTQFLSLLEIPEVALYSLQKEPTESDRPLLQRDRLYNLQDHLGDFADTAAAIAQLDLVITVDTSVAHLAGALGKPTWTLLPHVADWRWLVNREDNPWYPTMRLFRQSQPGDWAEVFQRVTHALQTEIQNAKCKTKNSSPPPPSPSPSSPHPTPHTVRLSAVRRSAHVEAHVEAPRPTPHTPPPLPTSTRLTQCRHGTLLYNVSDLTVGRSLDLYGEWNEAEINLFQSLLQLGDTVVDAGAGIGVQTLFLAKAVGLAGKVMAIEAQRMAFQTLCGNLALNGITNTHTYPITLGNAPGFLPISALEGNPVMAIAPGVANESVQVATLDSFAIPQCRLLRLDNGKMTLPVLQGAAQTLQRCQPVLYLVNPGVAPLSTPASSVSASSVSASGISEIASYLNSLGYELYWHHANWYNAQNFLQNAHNVFGTAASHNLLGFHRALNITVNGLERVG